MREMYAISGHDVDGNPCFLNYDNASGGYPYASKHSWHSFTSEYKAFCALSHATEAMMSDNQIVQVTFEPIDIRKLQKLEMQKARVVIALNGLDDDEIEILKDMI